jgi:predicted Zn-dependent peptidase
VRTQGIATDASAFTFDLSKGADLLVCDVTGRPGVEVDQLEEALLAVIDQLIQDGVTESERQRVLALSETAWVQLLQSASGRADKLSQYATYFSDPRRVNSELERYRACSLEQLNVSARRLLGTDNRASLRFVPRAEGAE